MMIGMKLKKDLTKIWVSGYIEYGQFYEVIFSAMVLASVCGLLHLDQWYIIVAVIMYFPVATFIVLIHNTFSLRIRDKIRFREYGESEPIFMTAKVEEPIEMEDY
jgi:hypothetical protein